MQSVGVDFKVNLDPVEEFGNYQIISQDFITPETTGTVEIKPRDYADLKRKIDQVSVVTTGETAGPYKSVPLTLDIVLHDPRDGTPLKTVFVSDAIFTLPGAGGKVNQKLSTQMPFESESGELYIIPGLRSA